MNLSAQLFSSFIKIKGPEGTPVYVYPESGSEEPFALRCLLPLRCSRYATHTPGRHNCNGSYLYQEVAEIVRVKRSFGKADWPPAVFL